MEYNKREIRKHGFYLILKWDLLLLILKRVMDLDSFAQMCLYIVK